MTAQPATVVIQQQATVPGSLFEVIADITFGDTYEAYTFDPADFGLNVITFVKSLTVAPAGIVINADAQYDTENNQIRLIVSSTGSEVGAIDASTYTVRAVVLGH